MGQEYVAPVYKDPGYAAAKQRSIEKTTGVYDAAIADASNKSAQAGAVQGVGNAGRLAADTYAKVSNEKNRRISAIEDQYNNYELQHKAAFNNQEAWAKQQYEMNKPGFLDWLGFGANLASGVASIPGVVSGIGKLFGGDEPTKTPVQTDMKGTSGLGINKDINNIQDIKPYDPFESQKKNPLSPMWDPEAGAYGSNKSIKKIGMGPEFTDVFKKDKSPAWYTGQELKKGRLKSRYWF